MNDQRSGHPTLRFLVGVGIVAALGAVLVRWLRGPATTAFDEPSVWPPAQPWPPLPDAGEEPRAKEPAAPTAPADAPATRRKVQVVKRSGAAPAKKVVRVQAKDTGRAATARVAGNWKTAVGGACPPGYPVKVKLRSGLYHEPGMLAYERTNPDRCYPSAAAAEADGFTRAKR